MSNGKTWDPGKHDRILRAWAGKITDAELGTITGHCAKVVAENRKRLELPAFHPKRIGWTRRDYLLAGAAGLNSPA